MQLPHRLFIATHPGTRLRSPFRCLVCVFAGLFLVCAVALAQVESGQIAGTVVDPSGSVIPNATVMVRNLANNAQRTTKSSPAGSYLVVGLEPGNYQVSVSSSGFQPLNENVEVTVGSHLTVNATLSVSGNTTEVQVVAQGGTAVNTQTQELSQVIDTTQLAQLPSLTRDPYDFVVLSGNVSNGDNTTDSAMSSQNLTSRGVGYAVNGDRKSVV